MKTLVNTLLMVLLLAAPLSAQTFNSRWASRSAVDGPQVSIIEPTTEPSHAVSSSTYNVEVLCTVGQEECANVTWTAPSSVTTSGSAVQSGNGFTWTFTVTLTCSADPGVANPISVVGNDGFVSSGPDVVTPTCITPDEGPPEVTITTNGGAAYSVSTLTTSLEGTAVDDVGISTLVCLNVTTSQSCGITLIGASWTVSSVTLQAGANTIRITATDQAAGSDFAEIVVTRNVPLAITTTTLAECTEDVACTLAALVAEGGTAPYTWTNNGAGTTLNDSDADCTGLTINSSGVVSGTPNPSAVPATCSFTAKVTDDVAATDTQALTLTIISASAEARHDYFEYQTSTRGQAEVDNSGTNKILRFDDCDHATYGDYGACRFSEDLTGETPTMTAALAKAQIASAQTTSPLDNEMGTKQNLTIGYAADTHANKQLGAKVVIVGNVFGDGLCDEDDGVAVDDGVAGCPGLRADENLEMTFANINIGNGTAGTLTFVVDDWFDPTWNANGINGDGTKVVSSCPGGQLGTRNMRKQYRIDAVGKLIWLTWKSDFRQANSDPNFLDDATGWWDCDDNVVAVSYTSGQNGYKKSFAGTLVSPFTLGVEEYDGGANPNGKGAFALRTNVNDFPIMHSRWNRRIMHIEYGVPANSSKFNDWKDDCYQADRTSTAGSYTPGAANDQSAVGGTADNKCAGMLTNDPATADQAGNCLTKDEPGGLATCSIVDQDPDCAVIDGPDCSSLWALVSSWVCDEVRGCQRTAYRVPWWQFSPSTGAALLLKMWRVEYDSSTPACHGCEDAVFYQGPLFGIVNIDPDDIDDTGCPSACIGDTGSVNSNLFRKPVSRPGGS